MNSAAYDLAYYVRNTLGKGTALGTDIFVNYMPNADPGPVANPAIDCISVFQYGGGPSNRGMGADTGALENTRLQVDVRNHDPNQAESICRDIHESLDELGSNVTINSTVYTWFHPLQPPFLLERASDGKQTTFAFNLECQRVRS